MTVQRGEIIGQENIYDNSFRPVPRFSWENIHGVVKQGDNGMVAPIGSPEIAQAIWQSASVLHVGRGYW